MISTESCNAIFSIIDRADKANVGFGALDQSVLGACTIASTNFTVDNYVNETGFTEAWQDSLLASPVLGLKGPVTIKTDSGEDTVIIPTSVHSKTMDDATDIIAQAATTALNHAQNVATPIISDFLDSVNDSVSGLEEFAEQYEVIDITPDEAWSSPVVLKALSNYDNFATPKVLKRADIPRVILSADYSPEIRTGSSGIDSLINTLLNRVSLTPSGVIDLIFNGNDDAGQYPAEYWRDQDIELLKFLTCQWLIDNPIPQSGMSGMAWSTITNQLSLAYGSLCRVILVMMERDVENDKLFYKHDMLSEKVYVNGLVYDRWLNAGGSPELIFGCLMQGDYAAITCKNMIDNSAKILGAWNAAHAALRNASRSKREANLREATFNAILSQIDSLAPENYAPGATKATMVALAKQVITNLSNFELNKLETCSIDIVCSVLFPHTPSALLLKDLNSQLEQEVPLQDALMCVAANYITDWVISSIVIYKA